jgi:hypothetical protein
MATAIRMNHLDKKFLFSFFTFIKEFQNRLRRKNKKHFGERQYVEVNTFYGRYFTSEYHHHLGGLFNLAYGYKLAFSSIMGFFSAFPINFKRLVVEIENTDVWIRVDSAYHLVPYIVLDSVF